MTRDDITSAVMARCNLSSTTAQQRINSEVQERYNWILGATGLSTSLKGSATASTVSGTRTVAFTMIRLDQLYITTGLVALNGMPFDELRHLPTASAAPAAGSSYAIQNASGTTVTVMLENTPASIVSLTADGLIAASDLTGSSVPAFPSIFHDVLVYGATAIELRKMEKGTLADANEAIFVKRMTDLSNYLTQTPV